MANQSTPNPEPRITPASIEKALPLIRPVARETPLQLHKRLSELLGANIWLKREDLQVVRSYKIRGAYHKMVSLSPSEGSQGVVCASAGNHAQGVALACASLKIHGKIFMPVTTPEQKTSRVKSFGGDYVTVILVGDTFDDSYNLAEEESRKTGAIFVHPYDDPDVVTGQGTVGLEIANQLTVQPDYVLLPIGGGGLAAGAGTYLKSLFPECHFLGVEPLGAPAMAESIRRGAVCSLPQIDTFVDGAAVQKVGKLTFSLCKEILEDVLLVPEGLVCSTMLSLHNEDGYIVEPAGALTIAALSLIKDRIRGKEIVCVVSGGNHDISRTEEIRERSLLYEGRKHYFIIRFPQRAGALREFVNRILGEHDDITHFEYTKKVNRQNGPALVGIELSGRDDYQQLLERMNYYQIDFQEINRDSNLFELLV